ncbi:hypothetical protein CR513_05570, partial [Mucuna pruriens]
MKAFPFSLDGAEKDWLYLQPVMFTTWGEMKRMFLKKFFLVSRTSHPKGDLWNSATFRGNVTQYIPANPFPNVRPLPIGDLYNPGPRPFGAMMDPVPDGSRLYFEVGIGPEEAALSG